jgi:hypothetical protein
MESTELTQIEQRARVHYEWSRAKRAVVGFSPVLVIVAGAMMLARHPMWTLTFGSALFVGGVALLWYGRDLKRAVLPGVASGLIPLALALCAVRVGHACTGDGCMVLCVPACTVGGLIAGLSVAAVGLARRGGTGFWLSASGVALLTGSMGCSCVGLSGVIGLGLGFALGTAPGLVRRVFGGNIA